MQETIKKWSEAIVPWLLEHGIKIVFIAFAAWLLNKILSRIIIRTVRVAIVTDENTSKEGERKRKDILTKPLKQWEITGELRKRLKIAFDREGIEIPFPQRVIHQIKSQD